MGFLEGLNISDYLYIYIRLLIPEPSIKSYYVLYKLLLYYAIIFYNSVYNLNVIVEYIVTLMTSINLKDTVKLFVGLFYG